MPDTTTSPSLATLSMTSTVLGSDLLIPIAVSADERMSRPFFVTVQVLSSDGNIDADSLLKTSCTVSVGTGQWGPRYFNGIIRSFAPDGVYSRGIYSYTLEIVPTLWLLSQTEDCRIWPQKRSLEIIGEMLFDIGVQVFDTLIDQGDQPVREYTVQYNETDLDFMTRLIEEEGYFYFFVHSENEHRLVIANQNVAFQSIEAGQMTVKQTTNPALDTVSNWSGTSMIVAGKARMTDYDPTAPSKKLDDHRTNSLGVSQPQSRDLYRWPARAMQEEEVTKKVKWRLDAADTASWLGSGMSGNWLFFPGCRFNLYSDPYGGADGTQYVVQRVMHSAHNETKFNTHAVPTYFNSFGCFPTTISWREKHTIPRPRMAGIFSGTVLGRKGDEIYTDEYGRVKVRLRFDYRHTGTAENSIWIRFMTPWAGSATANRNWGMQFIPRVGSEVAVAFMDADPDRPVVLGGFYNGNLMPPFTVPEHKQFSGLKTASTPRPQDGASRYHLFRFDDTWDCEQILLRSQGRLDVTAYASSFWTTYGNKNVKVVKGVLPNGQPVGGNMYTTVDQEYDLHVGTNRYEQVDKDYEVTVKGNTRADLEGNLTAVIKGDVSIGLNSLVIEATEKITLKVGASFIVLDPCAVYINGPSMIYENSGGSPDSAASATLQNVTDATAAEPGDQWTTRLTECHAAGSGGGPPSTHTVTPTPAPPCDAVVNGVSCGFVSGNGSQSSGTSGTGGAGGAPTDDD